MTRTASLLGGYGNLCYKFRLICKERPVADSPEYHSHDEYQTRLKKLEEIQKLGVNPYPPEFRPDAHSATLSRKYEGQEVGNSDDAMAGSTDRARVGGRLVLFRAMGKNAFAHIQDHQGRIQIMFNREKTRVTGYEPGADDPKPIKFIEKKFDLGDIIGVEGHVFRTNKGELTILAEQVTLLCKTLLPLPDKHAGLADKELRYRKRWLDLISSEQVRKTFRQRSQIVRKVRDYCDRKEFAEVETPMLQSQYGGANAKPFVTQLNALDQRMYLRIALELPLKKLIVGGLERVYEIGRVFRNEGLDRNHNPEFTLLEAYAAYWDYTDMMTFVENLFSELAQEIHGTTKVPYQMGETIHEIELAAPWPRLTMKEAIRKFADLDVDALNDDQLRDYLEKKEFPKDELMGLSRGMLIASAFETVEEHLIQPHHITDHPIETTPLCKPHRDPKERAAGMVERFETFIVGGEFCNAYTELNDPVVQRKLLEGQSRQLDAGNEEAHPMDEEFVESICQGMPPTGGLGIGIDRLVMLLTNSSSIRDVLFFPLMKRTGHQ